MLLVDLITLAALTCPCQVEDVGNSPELLLVREERTGLGPMVFLDAMPLIAAANMASLLESSSLLLRLLLCPPANMVVAVVRV